MKKLTFTSIFSQFLLLIFVIVWIVPTFGLFVSSLRDKDVLAISGWWTSFRTTEVNEIYRTEGNESQFKEGDQYFIKGNLFGEDKGKQIFRFGLTSKNIDEFEVGDTAMFKDKTEITALAASLPFLPLAFACFMFKHVIIPLPIGFLNSTERFIIA